VKNPHRESLSTAICITSLLTLGVVAIFCSICLININLWFVLALPVIGGTAIYCNMRIWHAMYEWERADNG